MAVVAIAAAIPIATGNKNHYFFVQTVAAVSIAVVGFNLLISVNGRVNLAQAAFYGLGAYAFAIAERDWNRSAAIAFCLAIIFAIALPVVLGPLLVKLESRVFSVTTLALGLAISASFSDFYEITGGHAGMSLPTKQSQEMSPVASYAITLLMLGIALMAAYWMRKRLVACDGSGDAGASISPETSGPGPRTFWRDYFTFIMSAAMAGTSGALLFFKRGFIISDEFDFFLMVQFCAMAALGGVGLVVQSVLGVGLYWLLAQLIVFTPLKDHGTSILCLLAIAAVVVAPRLTASGLKRFSFPVFSRRRV